MLQTQAGQRRVAAAFQDALANSQALSILEALTIDELRALYKKMDDGPGKQKLQEIIIRRQRQTEPEAAATANPPALEATAPEGSNTLMDNIDHPVRPSLRSGLIPPTTKVLGGIDFRALPIVTQAMNNLRLNIANMPVIRMDNIDLNQEWQEIQKMLTAGIIPSSERIKEYTQTACMQGSLWGEKDNIILSIADILRIDEESCQPTDPVLKDLLIVLESGLSLQELKTIFTGVKS